MEIIYKIVGAIIGMFSKNHQIIYEIDTQLAMITKRANNTSDYLNKVHCKLNKECDAILKNYEYLELKEQYYNILSADPDRADEFSKFNKQYLIDKKFAELNKNYFFYKMRRLTRLTNELEADVKALREMYEIRSSFATTYTGMTDD